MPPSNEDILKDPPQENPPVEEGTTLLGDEEESPEETAEKEKPKLTLQTRVDKPTTCERHVTVTICREDIDRYFREAIDEMLPKSEVPGFRPGRAPRKLVENRYRREVSEQIKGSLLMDAISQVSEEQEFAAISEPDFDYEAVEVPKEGPMTFEFDLEVRPEFDLPKWKGLKIERPVCRFGREHVDRRLKTALRRQGQLVPHEGPAEPGDYVVMNMAFRFDGKEVSSAEEQTICLRPVLSFPDGNIEDFDKLMAGAAAGDVRLATVTLSQDADNEQLRGRELEASFEVLDVKKLELPELDAGLLDRMGGFENEGELRDAVLDELERELVYHRRQQIRRQITALLTESADWQLPPALLESQSGRELDRAVMELQSAGFSDDQIRAHANELRQNSRERTATALKEHFILERIADEENIEPTEDDYNAEIIRIAYQSEESPRRIRARMEKKGLMDALRNQIVENKVLDLIEAHAEFTEAEYTPKVPQTEAVDHAIGGEKPADIPEAKHPDEARPLREPADHT